MNLWGARCDLRHPLARHRRREHCRTDAAHRDVASTARRGRRSRSTCTSRRSRSWPRRSCCRSRSSAGGSRSPRRSRSTARPAAMRWSRSPSRAASASRRASGSSSTRKARASAPARARKYKTGGARLAHRAWTCRSCRSRTTPATLWPKGLLGKRPGTITHVDRAADLAGGQGRGDAHAGSRGVDRGRSRAARPSE